MTDQPLPADIRAELCILGAILLDNSTLSEVEEKLRADDFSLDSHRRIFRSMTELARNNGSVDIVTLAHLLTAKHEIVGIGGVAYLASLTEGLPMRPVIADYIRIVKDKALSRRIMAICSAATARAADQSDSAQEILNSVQQQLQEAEHSSAQDADLESVGQWLGQNDIFAERTPGIMTGIGDYDELTYGLKRGELSVIGARPGMGKTSHAGTITWQMARRGKCVAVFLNEQNKKSFIGRMLCGSSGVAFKAYVRGTMDWVQRQYIEDAVKEFKTLPIFWQSETSMSLASIKNKSRRLKRSEELDAIVIDQLTGISDEGVREKGLRTDEVIGRKTKALKDLAFRLDVPVVLYHQLSRSSVRGGDGARPTLADLRGSGEIEQDADNVDFLHRPSYYGKEEPDEIIRAKCRDGETGIIKCEFVPWTCKWQDREAKR